MSEIIGTRDIFLSSLTYVFSRQQHPDRFFNMLHIYQEHYCPSRLNSPSAINSKFRRLADLWRVFLNAGDSDTSTIGKFITMYGHDRNAYKRYIWNIVLEADPSTSMEAISIVISQEFQALCKNYMNEIDAVKILMHNIIQALNISEGKYRNGLIKAILRTKIDKQSLARRAIFFDWLLQNGRSRRIENVINNYLFHEHIYDSLRRESGTGTCRLPEFCNKGHKLFCLVIDKIQSNYEIPPDMLFRRIITNIRDSFWKSVNDKLPGFVGNINDIRSIAEMAGLEDEILCAMESIRDEDLKHYHRNLLSIWLNCPRFIKKAVSPDDWYKVVFAEALPYCVETISPIIGMISVRESGDQRAFTNGKAIYLPSYVKLFNDPFMPIESNRNLSTYIALSLHEAGHILCGSYHFNIRDFVNSLERPDLFRLIHNVFEDYRIESSITRLNIHPQARELFSMVNRSYMEKMGGSNISPGAYFLLYIMHMANSYNNISQNVDYFPEANEFLDIDYYSGEFNDLHELATYGINCLLKLEVANPLSAIVLAEKFYDIMKHWPDNAINGMCETIMLPPPEVINGSPGNNSEPLTREQLDELYQLCNRDIESFLDRHGLRKLPASEVMNGGNENKSENSSGYCIPDYEIHGTIDKSTRTQLDDIIAGEQIEFRPKDDECAILAWRQSNIRKSDLLQEEERNSPYDILEKSKIKRIKVGLISQTKLSELKVFSVKNINLAYLKLFHQWEPIVKRVYVELSRLIPLIDDGYEITSEGDEIDNERLVELLSDHKHCFNAPDFFETPSDESRIPVEVLIGLDASGSTMARINNEGATILDIEKAFAIILGRALRFLTPDVRAYAFNSLTSTNIYRAESFEAISSFKSSEGNRDGDFIRYLTSLLKKSSAESRFIFLLSDGKPSSINYWGTEAMEDTLLAMREAVNSGIKLIYYNFDRKKSDYFDILKKEATYARYFTDPTQILPTIPEMLKSITTSVI